jgi:uncharacterized protein
VSSTLPVRFMDRSASEFWQHTWQEELRLQQCADCGKYRWPPAPSCDRCLSEQYEWTEVTGNGTVLSWVVFHRQYFPAYPPPHLVVAVELDEGPIFVATTDSSKSPSDGERVELAWQPSQDKFGPYNLPIFRVADRS